LIHDESVHKGKHAAVDGHHPAGHAMKELVKRIE